MGRTTYEWMTRNTESWPYEGRRAIVVTSRPLTPKWPGIETRADIDALIAGCAQIRETTSGCSAR